MGGTFARASPVADGGGGPQGQKGIAMQYRLFCRALRARGVSLYKLAISGAATLCKDIL